MEEFIYQFEQWKLNFDMRDDGLNAFMALRKLEQLRFIVATKSEGWEEEVERVLSG